VTSSNRRSLFAIPALLLAALPSLLSCQNNCGNLVPTLVNVGLQEFTVTPATDSAPAGCVTFLVANAGTVSHEFLVIRTDLAPNALPTNSDGSYQENGPGTELIDEIAEISPAGTAELTLLLESGDYVLICNMVIGNEAHYSLGMRAAFTVN